MAGRNINNLRYADDTTLTAESDLKCLSVWFHMQTSAFLHTFSLFSEQFGDSGPATQLRAWDSQEPLVFL